MAAAQHRSIDDTVRAALEVSARSAGITLRRPRNNAADAIAARRARAERFVEELAAMPILDTRPVQEIVDDLNAA